MKREHSDNFLKMKRKYRTHAHMLKSELWSMVSFSFPQPFSIQYRVVSYKIVGECDHYYILDFITPVDAYLFREHTKF